MGIDASESESADRSASRCSGRIFTPFLGLGLNLKRAVHKGAVNRWGLKMERRRQHFMLHCQQCFDGAGGTGAGQEMTDHRFDGSDGTLALFPVQTLPDSFQTVQFDGISHGCSGSVAFDKTHRIRRP